MRIGGFLLGNYLSKSRLWDIDGIGNLIYSGLPQPDLNYHILIYSVDIDGIGNPPIYVAVSGNGLFPPI
jgi:hypothetical protein